MKSDMVMINEYLREGNKNVGAIVAVLDNDTVKIGISKCHPLDQKKYNNEMARDIAIKRALNDDVVTMGLPHRHVAQVRDFIEVRCPKYFKRKPSADIYEYIKYNDEGKTIKTRYIEKENISA